jgi:hypothetical protein
LSSSDKTLIEVFMAEDQRKVAAGEAPSVPSVAPIQRRKRMKTTVDPVVGVVSTPVVDASAAADADSLMFSPNLFGAVQNRLRQPCTIDACASKGGGNALLPDFFDPCNTILCADLKS